MEICIWKYTYSVYILFIHHINLKGKENKKKTKKRQMCFIILIVWSRSPYFSPHTFFCEITFPLINFHLNIIIAFAFPSKKKKSRKDFIVCILTCSSWCTECLHRVYRQWAKIIIAFLSIQLNERKVFQWVKNFD